MQYSVISWCSRDNGFLKGLLSLPGKGEKKLLVFVNTKLLTLFKKKLFWDNCRSHAVVRNNIERIYLSPSLPYKQEADIDMNHQLYWNFTSLHTLISVYVCVWVCVCVCVCAWFYNKQFYHKHQFMQSPLQSRYRAVPSLGSPFTAAVNSLPCTFRNPGNHWSVFQHFNIVISRMLYK